jgi:alkylation response protein AidB-like acyl-CoA dehydrogenase
MTAVSAKSVKVLLAMNTLDHTRITIAAVLCLAQGALDVATKYAHERHQF